MTEAGNDGVGNTSTTCGLTGVATRQSITEQLARRLADGPETGERTAALFMVVDQFDEFVTAYGQQAGDIILKLVARTLATRMEPEDMLGRWDGHEFVALLSQAKPAEASALADKLRVLVERSSRQISNGKVAATLTIGVCVARPNDTVDSIAARVENCLHAHEGEWRNRVMTIN
ncbi:MAG: GGDEF domain-containing protein [Phycisphaerae bacterium]|nr:GGDEF domain-containing protein [Phycisphaerae bacterium]